MKSSVSLHGILVVLVVLSCFLEAESLGRLWMLKHPRLADQKEFLSVHNAYRAKANEPPLTWDLKLEIFAMENALLHHDKCEMVHTPDNEYGENLFWGGGINWNVTDAVAAWYNEARYYDVGTHSCKDGVCGHYTQVMWRDTLRVGCVKSPCKDNVGILIVCEYDPPGNYVDEDPFLPHNHLLLTSEGT